MPQIRVLDEQTINKIAAGEVIENPASVIKELVENSIDAEATEIVVEIRGGGRQLIRISDNGYGMSADNAVLCLERHATSKISQVEDIQDLITMGFRGEAIPSIAAISKFTLITTPKKDDKKHCEGTLVSVEGGKLLSVSPAARSPGTTIEVKALFFNVPVRRKFQKSPSYDTQEILKMMTILALGHPRIKFELISDQKLILDAASLPPDHSLQEQLGYRIETLLGKDFLHTLVPVSFHQEEYHLEGYISVPTHNRQNRTGQYLFINQRAIQSTLVAFAVREGYGTMLPTNRHPLFILHLQLPGALMDVNVHPQKREVRLRQEQILKDCIRSAIQKALQSDSFSEEKFELSNQPPFETSYQVPFSEPIFANIQMTQPEATPEIHSEDTIAFKSDLPSFSKSETPFYPRMNPVFEVKETPHPLLPLVPNNSLPQVLATLPGYLVLDPFSLLQIPAFAFLSSKGSEGLCLLSQKEAYARIYYERLTRQSIQAEKNPSHVQPLLFPLTIEFSVLEAALLKEHMTQLHDMGFNLQEFGIKTFIIDTIPNFIEKEELQSCLISIIQDLKDLQDTRRLQREKEKSIALAACRHSRISRKQLVKEEAQALLSQLLECRTPSQCPLGRPTIIHLSQEELAKQFQHKEKPC